MQGKSGSYRLDNDLWKTWGQENKLLEEGWGGSTFFTVLVCCGCSLTAQQSYMNSALCVILKVTPAPFCFLQHLFCFQNGALGG
jgi:hypothetical protein